MKRACSKDFASSTVYTHKDRMRIESEEVPEAQRVSGAQSGDARSFEILFDRYYDMIRAFAVGLSLLGATPDALAAQSVQIIELEGRSAPVALMPDVFGNREQRFLLEVASTTTTSGSLRADMFQRAGVLTMPVARDIHVIEGVNLSGNSPQRLRASLKFPEVKERAEINVAWSFVAVPSSKISLGNLSFEVFPDSVTKELTDLFKPAPEGPAPLVFGPGKKLRAFLRAKHVAFEDGGSDTPDRFDTHRLYFGELDKVEQFQNAQDRGTGARMVLFSPEESLPPGVYSERSSSGVLVHVTSPLLDNLAVDPRAQLALIKILHLLSAPSPATEPKL